MDTIRTYYTAWYVSLWMLPLWFRIMNICTMKDINLIDYLGKYITDIFFLGWVDLEESKLHGNLDYFRIYFEFNDELLLLSTDDNCSKLSISSENKIKYDFIPDEKIEKYIKISLIDLIFLDSFSDIWAKKYKVYYRNNIPVALEIILNNEQFLFIDSFHYTGIKIGESQLKNFFYKNNDNVSVRIFEHG